MAPKSTDGMVPGKNKTLAFLFIFIMSLTASLIYKPLSKENNWNIFRWILGGIVIEMKKEAAVDIYHSAGTSGGRSRAAEIWRCVIISMQISPICALMWTWIFLFFPAPKGNISKKPVITQLRTWSPLTSAVAQILRVHLIPTQSCSWGLLKISMCCSTMSFLLNCAVGGFF